MSFIMKSDLLGGELQSVIYAAEWISAVFLCDHVLEFLSIIRMRLILSTQFILYQII